MSLRATCGSRGASWKMRDRNSGRANRREVRPVSDRLHEPPVPLFDKRRVGNVPLLLLDDDLRARDIAREPLSMLPGHEHVGQAVDDPSWHADFGNVEAPW